MSSSSIALKLDRIRKEYDTKVAVQELSLQVPHGVIYGIIGPNGAGKTTTIRMIMNITAPDSGTIEYHGQPISPDFRDKVGYLPEERGLYKKMTCEEVILYMAELKSCPPVVCKPRVGPWLERMGLQEYRSKKVEELSKGMQQKLQFITTLIHEPRLVILDELFSGLDPINIELIKDVVLDLKRRGCTILFSTHVMEQAEKLCDHICMIASGKKMLDGSMATVKGTFGKNSIHVRMGSPVGDLSGLPGVKSVISFPNYQELRLNSDANPQIILGKLIEKGALTHFEVVEPSLYDIFIETAKGASIDTSGFTNPAEVTNA